MKNSISLISLFKLLLLISVIIYSSFINFNVYIMYKMVIVWIYPLYCWYINIYSLHICNSNRICIQNGMIICHNYRNYNSYIYISLLLIIVITIILYSLHGLGNLSHNISFTILPLYIVIGIMTSGLTYYSSVYIILLFLIESYLSINMMFPFIITILIITGDRFNINVFCSYSDYLDPISSIFLISIYIYWYNLYMFFRSVIYISYMLILLISIYIVLISYKYSMIRLYLIYCMDVHSYISIINVVVIISVIVSLILVISSITILVDKIFFVYPFLLVLILSSYYIISINRISMYIYMICFYYYIMYIIFTNIIFISTYFTYFLLYNLILSLLLSLRKLSNMNYNVYTIGYLILYLY